jgi:hypothetical protein
LCPSSTMVVSQSSLKNVISSQHLEVVTPVFLLSWIANNATNLRKWNDVLNYFVASYQPNK